MYLVARGAAMTRRNTSSFVSGAFSQTLPRASAVKPGSESEATTPGSGSVSYRTPSPSRHRQTPFTIANTRYGSPLGLGGRYRK